MSDEGAIERLDDETVRRIAAGEVVERPASAVKELIENSLDAGAARVAVRVDGDGTDLLRVRDDGTGMTADELRVAVEEHTTSKIGSADDLDRLGTLGFRGEALYTIGAVSRLEVRSRPPNVDRGHRIVVDNGAVGAVEPAACPPGTVVEVGDLFGETPARRKFLGTPATEFDHINRVVSQYALANPEVAVSLSHDGRETFATDGRGNLRSAVLSVYGREVAESMVGVDAAPEEAAVERVHGLVSHPETTRASRDYLATFVNGRYVPAAELREAVVAGYGGQLAADRYPFAVLFVEVPPGDVDVNVHPRKTEVRFDDPGAVGTAVTGAVEAALVDHGLVRSGAPRGRSQPAETRVEPERRGGHDGDDADISEPTADVSSSATDRAPQRSERAGPTQREATEASEADARAGSTDGDPESAESPRSPPEADDTAQSRPTPETDATGVSTADTPTPTPRRPGRGIAPTRQRTLDGESSGVREFDRLPSMRLLGQLHDTYLVAETPEGLVLVDQHAADERVNYERLHDLLDGETTTQALAEPAELEFTAREAALFEDHAEALASLGFHATRTGERTVEVRTVPTALDETLDAALLRDALVDLSGGDEESQTVDAVADDLLADLACHPSVTGNTSLAEGSALDLLAALDGCETPYACPHGRPTVVRIDREELEDRFERDYPGHGRRPE
jgi:DNA mismatch repair protein MutL